MIEQLAIAGYRSIRSLVLPLGPLNVITGANGSGKSNLYRALRLLVETADGRLIQSLAREGGFDSVLWAGPETISREMITGQIPVQGGPRKKPIALRLGIAADPFSYSLDVGLPQPSHSLFQRDPEIKRECLWRGSERQAAHLCADRKRDSLRCRSEKGKWRDVDLGMTERTSMLAAYADPYAAPELIVMREMLRSWRFYDTFRTDADAPARRPSIGTFTPIMSGDGSDLPAAFQTIREIGDADGLARAIDDAFPGSKVGVSHDGSGMQLVLQQPGMLRNLTTAELSDGTLRYFLLVAALLTPRPPELLVINEPENSLHPELIPALANLILKAAESSQVIIVSHNATLVEQDEICVPIHLEKQMGETVLEGGGLLDQYGWKWPSR
ncbi:MAG: AAA family ATPase [Planctomycetota bacterium]